MMVVEVPVPVPVPIINPHLPSFVPNNWAAHAAFVAVDKDQSGTIDWTELQAALKEEFCPNTHFPG